MEVSIEEEGGMKKQIDSRMFGSGCQRIDAMMVDSELRSSGKEQI